MYSALTFVRKTITGYLRGLGNASLEGWNWFWFTPTRLETLAAVRICAGLMLLYTHAVWTLGLDDFFGPQAWLSEEVVEQRYTHPEYGPMWKPSFWWWIESSAVRWSIHVGALTIFALLAVGFQTRVVSVLAFVLALNYTHRTPLALFGLDQINLMLAMYLMVGPSGAAYSVDRWLARWKAKRRGQILAPPQPSVTANISIRLIQLHMCLIYLLAGLGKMMGESWWNGSAMWMAFGNAGYQSMDMTWMAHFPLLMALITHVTCAWEIFYVALVWPRLSRPIMLTGAVFVHMGIGFCLGMMPFGLVMLIGNLAFVSPEFLHGLFHGTRPTAHHEIPSPSERSGLSPAHSAIPRSPSSDASPPVQPLLS